MRITICDRCGTQLPPIMRGEEPQDGRIRVNGAELCGECAAELEEFMQGAAVLKWNPVKVREITEEERANLIDEGYSPEEVEEVTMLDCFTPEDGQEILITYKSRISGRLYVEHDEAVKDEHDSWLDSGRDWEDVTAWAAMPEPYKERSGREADVHANRSDNRDSD